MRAIYAFKFGFGLGLLGIKPKSIYGVGLKPNPTHFVGSKNDLTNLVFIEVGLGPAYAIWSLA
jgi:hypothetical protein